MIPSQCQVCCLNKPQPDSCRRSKTTQCTAEGSLLVTFTDQQDIDMRLAQGHWAFILPGFPGA